METIFEIDIFLNGVISIGTPQFLSSFTSVAIENIHFLNAI